jgi:hypothetical protein
MKLVVFSVLVLGCLGCGGSGATSHVDSGRPGTGGATGSGGAAGAVAATGGGAGGAGVDASAGKTGGDAGACLLRDASADGVGAGAGQFSVVYDGGVLSSCLTTCSSCTGFYAPPNGNVELVMENSAGPPFTTTLYVTVAPGFQGVAYTADLELIEGNLSFAKQYQGVFSIAGGAVNIGPGACITISSVDLASGGGMSGTYDCDLVGQGVDNDQTTAHVTGSFSGLFL